MINALISGLLLHQEVSVVKQTMLHFDVFNSIKVSHNLLLGHKRGTENGFPFLYVCILVYIVHHG